MTTAPAILKESDEAGRTIPSNNLIIPGCSGLLTTEYSADGEEHYLGFPDSNCPIAWEIGLATTGVKCLLWSDFTGPRNAL